MQYAPWLVRSSLNSLVLSHITSRGNPRQPVFRDGEDREKNSTGRTSCKSLDGG